MLTLIILNTALWIWLIIVYIILFTIDNFRELIALPLFFVHLAPTYRLWANWEAFEHRTPIYNIVTFLFGITLGTLVAINAAFIVPQSVMWVWGTQLALAIGFTVVDFVALIWFICNKKPVPKPRV